MAGSKIKKKKKLTADGESIFEFDELKLASGFERVEGLVTIGLFTSTSVCFNLLLDRGEISDCLRFRSFIDVWELCRIMTSLLKGCFVMTSEMEVWRWPCWEDCRRKSCCCCGWGAKFSFRVVAVDWRREPELKETSREPEELCLIKINKNSGY